MAKTREVWWVWYWGVNNFVNSYHKFQYLAVDFSCSSVISSSPGTGGQVHLFPNADGGACCKVGQFASKPGGIGSGQRHVGMRWLDCEWLDCALVTWFCARHGHLKNAQAAHFGEIALMMRFFRRYETCMHGGVLGNWHAFLQKES